MKDIKLNKNGQISLVCFLCMLYIQPVFLILAYLDIKPIPMTIVHYILTLPLLLVSIIFGIKQLQKTKFPIFWIVPSFMYILLFLGFIVYKPLPLKYKPIPLKRKIGIVLNDTQNGKVQIIAVYYQSIAEKSGIKKKDIITKIGNETIDIESTKDVVDLIGIIDDPFIIEVERNGEKKIFNINRNTNKEDHLIQIPLSRNLNR